MVLETKVFRQSDFIKRAVGNVQATLVGRPVIASVIALFFLCLVASPLVALAAIPVSVILQSLTWGISLKVTRQLRKHFRS